MARPVVHGLRNEYQDRLNFVILDFGRGDERELATLLGVGRHPAYAVVPPDSPPEGALLRQFGPLTDRALRALLAEAIGRFPAAGGG